MAFASIHTEGDYLMDGGRRTGRDALSKIGRDALSKKSRERLGKRGEEQEASSSNQSHQRNECSQYLREKLQFSEEQEKLQIYVNLGQKRIERNDNIQPPSDIQEYNQQSIACFNGKYCNRVTDYKSESKRLWIITVAKDKEHKKYLSDEDKLYIAVLDRYEFTSGKNWQGQKNEGCSYSEIMFNQLHFMQNYAEKQGYFSASDLNSLVDRCIIDKHTIDVMKHFLGGQKEIELSKDDPGFKAIIGVFGDDRLKLVKNHFINKEIGSMLLRKDDKDRYDIFYNLEEKE